MAPEVLCGKTYKNEEGKTKLIQGYDFISEAWSLGCVLYECACLRSPFDVRGQTLKQLCHRVKTIDYQGIRSVCACSNLDSNSFSSSFSHESLYSPLLYHIVEQTLRPANKRMDMKTIHESATEAFTVK